MALLLAKQEELIKVISSKDSAVLCGPDEYQDYLDTLDESLLDLDPDQKPTRFVLKKIISEMDRQYLNAKRFKKAKKGRSETINQDYILEEIRICLVSIEQPSDIPEDQKLVFHFEGGRVNKEFLAYLDQAGVLTELHFARDRSLNSRNQVLVKKS